MCTHPNNETYKLGSQMRTNPFSARSGGSPLVAAAVASALAVGLAALPHNADAFEWTAGDNWTGSFDTTLSYGARWRVEGRDGRIISTSAGGRGRSGNIDDGNLNFDTGLVSSAIKATSEFELSFKEKYGIFVRGTGFYDFEANETERTDIDSSVDDKVEGKFDLLDAFAYARFNVGSMPAQFRIGEQVISWGESTFIQNGINIINHIDVSKLRVPGAELKEALLPQDIAYFSIEPTLNTSVELFYQYDWDDTEPDVAGSYFSNNDFAVDGGKFVMLGFGAWSDLGTDFSSLGGGLYEDFNKVPRVGGGTPDDGNQYGAAFRVYFDNLMNGTEFGFYYIRYHSRLPLISGTTGTQAGFGNAAGSATAVGGAAQALAAGLPFDAAVQTAAAQAVATAAGLGGTLSQEDAVDQATIGANTYLGSGGDAVASLSSSFASYQLGITSNYFTEFPEDLDLYGVSFNTFLPGGIAWQGEVSLKKDAPLQFDDVEVLFAALSPLDNLGAQPGFCPTNPQAVGRLGCYGQLGPKGLNERIQGWDERDWWQFQTTLTYLSGPLLGANSGAFVWEGGATYIDDFPDGIKGGPNNRGLRYNGEGTSVSGNSSLAGSHFGEVEGGDHFPDEFSWGYQLIARLDYNNLVGPWTVSPRVGWRHDVSGNTPGPGGSFLEDRTALSLGIRGNLQNKWELDVSYTQFDGAGRYYTTNDRDFIGFTAKFSF